uniref:Predicted protein n=1 Tax=Hordeum vulgare subsp. vulgare TaxID=112509 RepID=F2E7E1_HORVV|nr:predicted protein [Hordeum vulgare subsp. vulgare]
MALSESLDNYTMKIQRLPIRSLKKCSKYS